MKTQHVVIVGGGFAGLNAAKGLARLPNVSLTLVDKRNHHLFQPLLYQVALAGLSPADIAVPIRSILSRHPNARVQMDEVVSVNLESRSVSLLSGNTLNYDYLVMACGATHSYFGHENWEPFAPGLKTLEQATEIRRRVLLNFERAEIENDPAKKTSLQTFVVVGGGPTGVELAGAIGEMSRYTLKCDFRSIEPTQTRIFLIEAGPRILSSFTEELSQDAQRSLEELGVTVITGRGVTQIDERGVSLGEERIETACVLWAAGVRASELGAKLGVELDRQGRVMVNEDLSLPKHPEVFVLGDQAHVVDPRNGGPLPGLAPVAIQQGRHVVRVIQQRLRGRPSQAFRYKDKGQMATIGRKKAVAESDGLRLRGFPAWVMWIFIHVYYLIGFENRLIVLIQWAWSYFTFQRGARLIVEKRWESFGSKSP